MSKTWKDARGRRYSAAERAKILEFIEEHNRTKGKGGQLAAYRKFGIAQKNWMRDGVHSRPAGPKPSDPVGRTLDQLEALHRRIGEKEVAIRRLRARYDLLKAEI